MHGVVLNTPQAEGQKAKIFFPASSSVFLPETGPLRRLPRAPKRQRPQKFWDGFEDRALIYDVFWNNDGSQVLMVCPPPMNLEAHWRAAVFRALPSGKSLRAELHNVRSSMSIALQDAPPDTQQIEIGFAGQSFVTEIMPNLSEQLAGARVLFTMSQNNPLHWVFEWARYHRIMHGADTIIIFDNGSTAYGPEALAETLASVPGIKNVLVLSWPHKYGPHDPGVIFHRFWANFLQISSFSVILRRLAGRAYGIANLDIDELAAPIADSDIFEAAKASPDGFYRMAGNWVESVTEPGAADDAPVHTAYRTERRDVRHRLNAKKWVLDPSRSWLDDLEVHPSVHRVMNMPKEMHRRAPVGLFWHFKGINTNWKSQRHLTEKRTHFGHQKPAALEDMFARYAEAVKDLD